MAQDVGRASQVHVLATRESTMQSSIVVAVLGVKHVYAVADPVCRPFLGVTMVPLMPISRPDSASCAGLLLKSPAMMKGCSTCARSCRIWPKAVRWSLCCSGLK